jgi:uncharacterized protein (DUF58 family)
MSSRIAPAALSSLTLIGVALFLGFLSGRPELIVVAVPLCLPFLWAVRPMGCPDYRLSHTVSSTRLFEGERLAVTVRLTSSSHIPAIELLEPLPPSARVVSGANRAVFTLRPGQETRWHYEFECRGRSRFTPGTLYVRVWEGSGLRLYEAYHPGTTAVAVYPRVAPLRHVPRPRRTQTSAGDYVSPAFGEGLEPGEIRPFAPGDRVRHVNWRASLRLGKLYVTQHHLERNADIVLMLDTLARVGTPPASSLDLCVGAASALAGAYLARKDRVGLIEYGGILRWVRPASGRPQLERILNALLDAQVMFSYVTRDLAMVPPRVLPSHALVIGLSPLLDSRFLTALGDLVNRGFDVVLLSVSPIDVTRMSLACSPVEELACRLWSLERQAQLADLRRQGLRVVEWHPDHPLELALEGLSRNWRRRRVAA